MEKNKNKLAEELKKKISKIKIKETKSEKKIEKPKKENGKKLGEENSVDEMVENGLKGLRKISPSLRPVAEVRGINPVHLEKSLANVWVDKEDKEELYSAKNYGKKNEREYDTNKAVKEGVFYEEGTASSGKRTDMQNIGRKSWIESQIKETGFVNPEEKLRKTSKNIETDYIHPKNVDIQTVGRDVIKKTQEYWVK